MKQLVDGFALLETRERTVLPQDGRGIRERALETVVAAAQGAMAELEALIENLPEGVIQILDVVMVAGCLPNFQSVQSNIGEVDGDGSLIETSVELVVSVLVFPWA